MCTDRYYILDGTALVPADLLTWGQWCETHARHVAETWVTPAVRVSTIFLGVDHRLGCGPPLVFETMVFGGKYDHELWRYSTWHEAEQGHEAVIALVRRAAGMEET